MFFDAGVGWVEAERTGELWKRREDAGEEENHRPVARCRRQPAEASGREGWVRSLITAVRDLSSNSAGHSDLVGTRVSLPPGSGGGQCQAGGEPGLSVGETPRSTHRRAPQTQRNLRQPRCKWCLTTDLSLNLLQLKKTLFDSDQLCPFSSAGIIQKAVWNQVSAWQNPSVYRGGQEEGRNLQTTGNGLNLHFIWMLAINF